MPELPEVETMVRGVRESLQGRRLVGARPIACDYRPLAIEPSPDEILRRTRGCTVTAVERCAKKIVIRLDSGDAFVIEPRMTGLLLVSDPPDVEHLRFEWLVEPAVEKKRTAKSTGKQGAAATARAVAVRFWDRRGLGTIRLLDPVEQQEALGESSLGPDALVITLDAWRTRCAGTSRAIKVALLDQRFVAGIGNLYASEILHLARIHPATRCDRLDRPQTARLYHAVRDVLLEAIVHEGSTLSDGTYRNALNQSGSYQNAHRVYDRADEKCATCRKGTIERIVQAQRSTFFCPRCQKPPAAAR